MTMTARIRHEGTKTRRTVHTSRFRVFVSSWLTIVALVSVAAQTPTDSWPTYHGDWSGRRYSALKQIDTGNVKYLSLAWLYRLNTARGGAILGGEGPDTPSAPPGVPSVKSTPLLVNGILYFSAPDHVWAVDARTGREVWHFAWKTRGGDHIGNRGVGIFGNWLYFLTPDNYFVSLDLATGKERWHHEIANLRREYFSTNAPIVIGKHVIIGVGGDALDLPGYLESRDPESGSLVWRWNSTPKPGEPGSDTWPDEYSMSHGGGMPWIPGTYDPELNLYYFGTGNANPVLTGQNRAGDNLYTCTIVALNPDTGKMVWYYQATPHDTHDWDAAQTPVLIDGVIDGRPRKLLAQANRNGYFFLLDRTNGQHVLTAPFIDTVNWATGIDAQGRPIPNPAKAPTPDGVLVSPPTGGATNWPPPSFDPETGLFYVGTSQSWGMFYKTDTDDHPEGWGGTDVAAGGDGGALLAIDYKTDKIAWRHDWPAGGGASHFLTTAGHLLFTGNGNYLIAFDPSTGKILWHTQLKANPSAGPITYLLDNQQQLLVVAGDTLYSFTLTK